MKLVSLKCPNCGANVEIQQNQKNPICENCGSTLNVSKEVDNHVNRAFDCISQENFIKAKMILDEASLIDSKSGEIYLGYLMCDLKCRNPQSLANRKEDYSNNLNYIRALQFLSENKKKDLENLCLQNQNQLNIKVEKKVEVNQILADEYLKLEKIEINGNEINLITTFSNFNEMYQKLKNKYHDSDEADKVIINLYNKSKYNFEKINNCYNQMTEQDKNNITNFDEISYLQAKNVFEQVKEIAESQSALEITKKEHKDSLQPADSRTISKTNVNNKKIKSNIINQELDDDLFTTYQVFYKGEDKDSYYFSLHVSLLGTFDFEKLDDSWRYDFEFYDDSENNKYIDVASDDKQAYEKGFTDLLKSLNQSFSICYCISYSTEEDSEMYEVDKYIENENYKVFNGQTLTEYATDSIVIYNMGNFEDDTRTINIDFSILKENVSDIFDNEEKKGELIFEVNPIVYNKPYLFNDTEHFRKVLCLSETELSPSSDLDLLRISIPFDESYYIEENNANYNLNDIKKDNDRVNENLNVTPIPSNLTNNFNDKQNSNISSNSNSVKINNINNPVLENDELENKKKNNKLGVGTKILILILILSIIFMILGIILAKNANSIGNKILLISGIIEFALAFVMFEVALHKERYTCPCCGHKRVHHRQFIRTEEKISQISSMDNPGTRYQYTHVYEDTYVCPNCGETLTESNVKKSGGELRDCAKGTYDHRVNIHEF